MHQSQDFGIYNLKIFAGVIYPQKCPVLGIRQLKYPNTNFRLARQRSNCSCFSKPTTAAYGLIIIITKRQFIRRSNVARVTTRESACMAAMRTDVRLQLRNSHETRRHDLSFYCTSLPLVRIKWYFCNSLITDIYGLHYSHCLVLLQLMNNNSLWFPQIFALLLVNNKIVWHYCWS